MSPLDHRVENFEDRDAFLALLLGLVSASARLDAVLEGARKGEAEPETGETVSRRDETTMQALLGIVSVHRRLKSLFHGLRSLVDSAAPEAENPSQPARDYRSTRFLR